MSNIVDNNNVNNNKSEDNKENVVSLLERGGGETEGVIRTTTTTTSCGGSSSSPDDDNTTTTCTAAIAVIAAKKKDDDDDDGDDGSEENESEEEEEESKTSTTTTTTAAAAAAAGAGAGAIKDDDDDDNNKVVVEEEDVEQQQQQQQQQGISQQQQQQQQQTTDDDNITKRINNTITTTIKGINDNTITTIKSIIKNNKIGSFNNNNNNKIREEVEDDDEDENNDENEEKSPLTTTLTTTMATDSSSTAVVVTTSNNANDANNATIPTTSNTNANPNNTISSQQFLLRVGRQIIRPEYILDDNEQEEEVCELMKDTFTFLMTAKYPLQDSRLCKCRNIIEEEEEEEDEEENVPIIIDSEANDGGGGGGGGGGTSEANGTQNHHHEEGEKEEAPSLPPETNDDNKIPIIREGRTGGEGVNTKTTTTTTSVTQTNKKLCRREALKKRASIWTKHRKSLLKNVDPDQLYLPFWLATFVVFCQLFIYLIVNLSMLNDKLPPNADQLLRLAQVFAVLVTLYTQSDFIDGIFLLTERWKSFKDITTPGRFYTSAMIRIITGNIGIFTTFILVMYSEEVVDMLLNFTAMEFVAKLDDAAFELASKGFLGGALESHTDIVRGFKYVPRHNKRRRHFRLFIYLFYFCCVFGGFFAIVALQGSRSVGIDNEVYIQFDDTGLPELFGVSGVYKGCRGFRTDTTGDIAYIDISSDCPSDSLKVDDEAGLTFPAGIFIYCRDPTMKSWVYIAKATNKPCEVENFLIGSILDDDPLPTHAFDILTHSLATWIVVRGQSGSLASLENVFIRSAKQVPVFFTYCGSDGDGGLVRLDKELKDQRPFERLPKELYPIFEDDSSDLNGESYFDAFQLVYRPIYVRKLHDVWGQDHTYQILVFDGLRWNRVYINPVKYATFNGKQAECQNNADRDPDCWMIFIKYFKNALSLRSRYDLAEETWRSNPDILVFDGISDPMLFLTATDTGIPTEKTRWYESRIALNDVEFGGGFHITPGQPKPAYDGVPRFSDSAAHHGSSSIIDANENEDGTIKQGGRRFAFTCNVDIELNCDATAKELYINFGTDIFPEESSVLVFYGEDEEDMKDLDTANRIFARDTKTKIMRFDIPDDGLVDFRFLDHSTDHVLGTCVPESRTCVQVIVLDEFGDGLTGFVDDETGAGYQLGYGKGGVIVEGGGGLYRCRLYQFGDACKNSRNSAEPINCDYDNVMENFPQHVIGEVAPYKPSLEDFLQGTFVVTYEPAEEDVPQPISFELDCAENEIGLKVDIIIDTNPKAYAVTMFFGQNSDEDLQAKSEAYQLVPTSNTGQFELSEDSLVALTFPFALTSYAVGTCIPVETPCIQIMVMDKDADGISDPGGYTIAYGAEEAVSSSGSGNSGDWGCRHYQFGSGCITTLEKIPDECDTEALLSKVLLENIITINF